MIVAINDEDAIMIVIDRNAVRTYELAELVALHAELGHERAIITREYLRSMIAAIGDEQQTSMMVERQASRIIEQAISIATFLGADRELDSSVTIKSIVSHLFQSKISLATTKRYSQIPQTSRTNQEMETHTQQQRDDERRKEHYGLRMMSLTLSRSHTNNVET